MLEHRMSQAISGLALLLSCTFATSSALAANVKNINVDCNKPNASIQNEIDKVKSGEAITIYIVGICNESVNIIKDDITLSGNEAGNECDKTNPGGTGTINGTVIVDSVRAKIEHLTITGSDDGVGIINRATAQLNCNDISNNEASGVYVLRSSNAVLRNNRVSGNGTREADPGVFFDCGLFAADASSVDSRGNTYSDNQYCAIEIDRQAAFRNGAFLPRRPGEQANPAERDTFIEKGCDPSSGTGCFNEFTENDTVAIIAFNGGLIDLRNADISGFVEVEGLSSYRVDGDATAQGHIYNDIGSLVRIRDRGTQFPGRKVTYKGTLSCFNGAQTLYSNVQCGQTCNGDIPGTCFFAP
ncbi:MAG: right-handed parallel beta-helix repeat-containing protein [Gammaproteobacteria bacterium]|nr:right-handed parallel beta-helix repeat-containing protein [Gammaproteobacteria bacterium]